MWWLQLQGLFSNILSSNFSRLFRSIPGTKGGKGLLFVPRNTIFQINYVVVIHAHRRRIEIFLMHADNRHLIVGTVYFFKWAPGRLFKISTERVGPRLFKEGLEVEGHKRRRRSYSCYVLELNILYIERFWRNSSCREGFLEFFGCGTNLDWPTWVLLLKTGISRSQLFK